MLPEPLSTVTSTMLLNIASDIVENHAKDLESTFAGRLLKLAGLIQPNFQDRLRDTLKQSLRLFFQKYPKYNLSGIELFFGDPNVTRQIGEYVLNHQSIDEKKIQEAFDTHLSSDAITSIILQRRKITSQIIIHDFLACYYQILSQQLSVAEMSLLAAMLEQSDHVVTEMKEHEERLKEFVIQLLQTQLSPQGLKAASQVNQQAGTTDLIHAMGSAKLVQPDDALQTIQQRLQSLPSLFTEGLCKGRIPQPAPQQYFVSQGFLPDTLVDWRKTLNETLAQSSHATQPLTPYFAGDTLMGGSRLCSICEKLFATRFSIFLLPPSQNRNVYLELGIAIGMRAPFLLIQPLETSLPPLLEGLTRYITNGTFRSLRQELPEKLGKVEDYNFAVVSPLKKTQTTPKQSHYLISAGDLVDDEDLEWSLNEAINHAYPHVKGLSSKQQLLAMDTTWALEHLVDLIQTTRFAIYRVNEQCSPTTFLALGISIALNQPFLMVHEKHSDIPMNLRGIGGIYSFANFSSLEKDFILYHQAFFARNTS